MLGTLHRHARAHAVAYVALFVALGGTAVAAGGLGRNSVGTRQLRNRSVTGIKTGSPAAGARMMFGWTASS